MLHVTYSIRPHRPGRRARTCGLMLPATVLVACTLFSAGAYAACNRPANWGAAAGVAKLPAAPASLTQQPATPASSPKSGSAAAADRGEGEGSIVGLWHVLFLTGSLVVDEGFDMWNAGGTEILNDTMPPPLPPYSTGVFCLGVYKQTAPGAFRQRHPYWVVDATGFVVGTGVIVEEVTLGSDGNSYSGTFENISYDLNGNVTGDVTGTLKAERIKPD
jgi:hypothetical protein